VSAVPTDHLWADHLGNEMVASGTLPKRYSQASAGVAFSLALAVLTTAWLAPALAASPYVVASYPVDATAGDAVAAKAKATADGELGALRYLMKRLVPVGDYRRLPKLPLPAVENLLEGMSVGSEQNSGTEYIATLDFSFRVDAVRSLLVSQGLPFLDKQAPTLTVIPVFAMPPDKGVKPGATVAGTLEGQKAWRQAWSGLDLTNSLTPIKLAVAGPSATNETFLKLIAGDRSGLGTVQSESSADKLLLAIAAPSADGSKLTVALVGDDWSGPINLRRTYTLYYKDLSYTSEWAAVIALGVLEGRWKEVQGIVAAGGGPVAETGGGDTNWTPAAAADSGPVIRMTAEFSTFEQWQEMRARLHEVAGPQNVEVGAISARGAELAVNFAGGPGALQARLASQGLALANVGGRLVLRAAN